MKSESRKEKTANRSCATGRFVAEPTSAKNSINVSSSSEDRWTELTKQIVHENIEAWKTLSKE